MHGVWIEEEEKGWQLKASQLIKWAVCFFKFQYNQHKKGWEKGLQKKKKS